MFDPSTFTFVSPSSGVVAPVILSVIPEAVLPLIELNIPKPRTPIILDPSSGIKLIL